MKDISIIYSSRLLKIKLIQIVLGGDCSCKDMYSFISDKCPGVKLLSYLSTYIFFLRN
jgi:hypothetical protein